MYTLIIELGVIVRIFIPVSSDWGIHRLRLVKMLISLIPSFLHSLNHSLFHIVSNLDTYPYLNEGGSHRAYDYS
jgi:hypothetical protein